MYEPALPRFYYQTISKSQTLIAEILTVGNLLDVHYTDPDLTSDFEVTDYVINYSLRRQAVLFLELEKPVSSTVSLYQCVVFCFRRDFRLFSPILYCDQEPNGTSLLRFGTHTHTHTHKRKQIKLKKTRFGGIILKWFVILVIISLLHSLLLLFLLVSAKNILIIIV